MDNDDDAEKEALRRAERMPTSDTLQTLGDEKTVVRRLERVIADRVGYLKGIPIPKEKHFALGAEQFRQRIEAILSETVEIRVTDLGDAEEIPPPTLDLYEAVLAIVSTLAHFSVAVDRPWKGQRDERTD